MAVKYTELFKQVLGIIFIPLFYSIFYIYIILNLKSYHLSETMETIVIFSGIFLLMGASVLSIFRFIMVDGEIGYDNTGIQIHLTKKSFLFPFKDSFISFSDIKNAALTQDASGKVFFSIKTKSPDKTIIITPQKAVNINEFIDNWNQLAEQINNYNDLNKELSNSVIATKGFYESTFIKVLAYITFVLFLIITITKILKPDLISIWKLILFYCYAFPFMFIVFKSNKKSV